MQKKRILYIHGITDLAGGEFFLLSLITHLPQDQNDVSVVLPDEGALTRRLRETGVRVHILPFMGTSGVSKVLSFIWALPKLFTLLKNEKIDLIHANDFKPAILAGLAAKLLSIPVIWTVHHSLYKTGSNARKFLITTFISRIISVSQTVQKQFAGYPVSRLSVIYIGIDTDRFKPADGRQYADDRQLTITTIGRFDPAKGLDTVVRAAAILKETGLDLHFLLVCSDFHTQSNDYRTSIADLIEEEHLEQSLELIPFTDRIEDVYERSDLVLSPSQYEPLGLTVLEAMSCQIPVIATRSGGPEETVIDQKTGFLIPVNDAGALAETIEVLAADPILRQTTGAQGRAHMISHFSLSRMIESYGTLYSSLLPPPQTPDL